MIWLWEGSGSKHTCGTPYSKEHHIKQVTYQEGGGLSPSVAYLHLGRMNKNCHPGSDKTEQRLTNKKNFNMRHYREEAVFNNNKNLIFLLQSVRRK